MTDQEIQRIIADAEAATPGPWSVKTGLDSAVADQQGSWIAAFSACYPEGAISIDDEDLRHIANLNPAVAIPLLCELLRLRGIVRALAARDPDSQTIEGYCEYCGYSLLKLPPTEHDDACLWRRAVEYVHETEPQS